MNVLFTSVGRRVSLIRHFKQALRSLCPTGRIVAIDSVKNAPAFFVADHWSVAPLVTDSNYINHLKDLCVKHEIGLLVPLIDTELNILSEHRNTFKEIGVAVLVSSSEVNKICLDKRETFNYFKKIGVKTPELLDPDSILKDPGASYPYLIKPFNGSSSIGVTKINNKKELQFFKQHIRNAIVQEYVEGDEYTIDVLADFKGRVVSVVPRLRIETRSGEVSKGVTVKNHDIIEACKKVVESLPGVLGCLTLQCFLLGNGEIKFIEINPRFGGGFPLSIAAGADFPKWILEMLLYKREEFEGNSWKDGLMMLRYDDALFLDVRNNNDKSLGF